MRLFYLSCRHLCRPEGCNSCDPGHRHSPGKSGINTFYYRKWKRQIWIPVKCPMTTAELTKALAERLGVNQRQARTLLDAYVGAIKHQLDKRNSVVLLNFGTFSIKEVAEKRSYLPARKSLCLIPAHSKLSFKAAKKLREEVSENTPDE